MHVSYSHVIPGGPYKRYNDLGYNTTKLAGRLTYYNDA